MTPGASGARLDPAVHSWMNEAATRAVMNALLEQGGEARFVGGAIRNALLHEPVLDIDIATPLLPDDVMARLRHVGLGAVGTGIAHGTVTAIARGKPFEITTLRRDVATDGRHAVVAFTTDWAEDAARRDFTMNALYADTEGTIFDYCGGIADLEARRVRFVGEPDRRIREDYLRILRLFRFHAWYGRGDLDAQALAAASTEKAGLRRLSGERVQKETLRLLTAADPVPMVRVMEKSGILAEILPGPAALATLSALIAIEAANALAADALLRLAVLIPGARQEALALAAKLKLSNAMRDRLARARDPLPAMALSPIAARHTLYRLGVQGFRDRFLLAWAASGAAQDEPARVAVLALAAAWSEPRFPLTGEDAIACGVVAGPAIGQNLRAVEDWWIAQDFVPTRPQLLARLKDQTRGQGS